MIKIFKEDRVIQVKREKSLIQRCSKDISKPIIIFSKEEDGKPLILMSSLKTNDGEKRR